MLSKRVSSDVDHGRSELDFDAVGFDLDVLRAMRTNLKTN
jgi:hypothetical protein